MSQIDAAAQQPFPALAIFTDFDGTLVELAETPDAVEVPASLPEQIERTIREFGSAFAVITGRQIADIDHFLAPLHLPIAGGHGTQRRRADGTLENVDHQTMAEASEIAALLAPLVQAHPELLMEAKESAVALHYRQAPELKGRVLAAMEAALVQIPHFTLVHGKMVFEARPTGISKGTALRAFMQEEPFRGRTPVFIGDDRTDEDGFIAAQELGGIGIKLGDGDTAARMRIADVPSVHALLQGLGDLAARDRQVEPFH